jgi:tetratricopeptide (TPR) repeat protein
LAGLFFALVFGTDAAAQNPKNKGDEAWLDGRFERATALYRLQALAGQGGDTTWFNVGTAALASGDTALARSALETAARSIEPDIRFRARYNLGILELRLAVTDTAQLTAHLDAARSHYQEALLLRPSDSSSKWNLELASLMMPPPPNAPPDDRQNTGAGQEDSPEAEPQGLSVGQAEQILNSIAEEERRTLLRRNRNRSQIREARGRRDW